jgi:capsular polysaccharide biosynthesis protein
MIDVIPKLGLVELAGIGWDRIDHVVLRRFSGGSFGWILPRLGIPAGKIVWAEEGQNLTCDVLLQPSFPGVSCIPPPWAVELIRSRLALAPAKPPTRRLFIPRKPGTRAPRQAAEVEQLFRSHGFEVFGKEHMQAEREVLSQTAILAGPHGSGLTVSALMPPGGLLIELTPANRRDVAHVALASAAGHRVALFVGEGPECFEPVKFLPSEDFDVNLERLARFLDAVLPKSA